MVHSQKDIEEKLYGICYQFLWVSFTHGWVILSPWFLECSTACWQYLLSAVWTIFPTASGKTWTLRADLWWSSHMIVLGSEHLWWSFVLGQLWDQQFQGLLGYNLCSVFLELTGCVQSVRSVLISWGHPHVLWHMWWTKALGASWHSAAVHKTPGWLQASFWELHLLHQVSVTAHHQPVDIHEGVLWVHSIHNAKKIVIVRLLPMLHGDEVSTENVHFLGEKGFNLTKLFTWIVV